MNKLNSFFKTINKFGLYFIEKAKKPLEDFSLEVQKINQSSSIVIGFTEFKNSSNLFLDKLKSTLDKLNTDLIEPFDNFLVELNNKNNEFLSDLSRLNTIVQQNKMNVEKSKNNYFNLSKETSELEQKYNKLKENNKTKDETLRYQKDLFYKSQNNSINAEMTYKKDLKKLNKCLEEGDEKYQTILDNLENEETSRLNYIILILQKFSIIFKLNSTFETEYSEQLKKIGNNINIKRDIKVYNNALDFKNENKIRFPIEQFLNYEIFKKSESNDKINNNLYFLQNQFDEKILGFENNKSLDNIEFLQLIKEDIKTKDTTLESNIEKLINDTKPLPNDELTYNINQIEFNKNNSILFMKYLSTYYKDNAFVEIKCLENIHHLSSLLSIILTNSQSIKEILYLNFILIYLAEKTVYINPENKFNKCYLSKLISKNKLFSEKEFWNELLDMKISNITDIKVKNELEKKNQTNETGVLFNIKNIFGGGKIKENKKIENEIVYRQLYLKKLPTHTVEVLDEYILHFSNFNFAITQSMELITEFSVKYKFDKSYVSYFMAKLNSNTFTVQNKNENFDNEKKVNYENLFFNTDKLKNKKIYDFKLLSILYSIKYMNIKELQNILPLNKMYNEKIRRFVFKNILLKYHDMSIENHIKIWKVLLNFNQIKKKYDYNKIKIEVDNFPNLVVSKEIIQLDVLRTYFKKDRHSNREKTSNILRAACKETPSINYCQGMNYIVAFLLSITENEEDTFYLFLSLLISTDYGSLFSEDLEKLKKFFYVFERLINIFLPELYSYFLDNNINVSYFISPWFITLFTNVYPHNSNLTEPKIILRIWDLFLFNGWNSIIKIGISIIKHFEDKLLTLTFETLLRFLINDIIKSDFFENENFDTLTYITLNFKIGAGLITNLENEYELKKKIPPIGE